MDRCDDDIDNLNSDKRNDDSTKAVYQQVALQSGQRTTGRVFHPAQSQWNQSDNDQRIENDGA